VVPAVADQVSQELLVTNYKVGDRLTTRDFDFNLNILTGVLEGGCGGAGVARSEFFTVSPFTTTAVTEPPG
jgi:hypothetical protein